MNGKIVHWYELFTPLNSTDCTRAFATTPFHFPYKAGVSP